MYDAMVVLIFLVGAILGHLLAKWFITERRRSR